MKGLTRHIKSDKIIRWSVSLSAIILLGETIYALLFFFSLPPFLPLYNQMPWEKRD